MHSEQYEQIRVADLIPYERNARTHSDEQIEKICKTIFGSGFLISEKAAAEKAAAEKFPLSDREREIVRGLGK